MWLIAWQVGLAVDDIKGILEKAALKRLALQVRERKGSVLCLFFFS